MAAHKRFTLATDIKVYFCDPHSLARGRMRIRTGSCGSISPRGMTSLATRKPTHAVARKLNDRPEDLNYETPAERFSQSVASTLNRPRQTFNDRYSAARSRAQARASSAALSKLGGALLSKTSLAPSRVNVSPS